MSGDKKPLRPHALTCILRELERRLTELLPSVGLAYTLHRDREDCWSMEDSIPDYYCAVNIVNRGYSARGREKQRTLRNGETVCTFEASADIEIQVYGEGCNTTNDTLYSILAEIAAIIHARGFTRTIYANQVTEGSTSVDVDSDFSQPRRRATQTFTLLFDYAPSRPSLVFGGVKS